MALKSSSIVKIAAAIAIAAVVIMQALQSNEQCKMEKISEAILTLEQKVSTELEAVEKEEKNIETAFPAATVSPSPSVTPGF